MVGLPATRNPGHRDPEVPDPPKVGRVIGSPPVALPCTYKEPILGLFMEGDRNRTRPEGQRMSPRSDVSNRLHYRVAPEEAGTRLDRFLMSKVPGAGRRDVTGWIDAGRVQCHGQPARKGLRLPAGCLVELAPPDEHRASTVGPEPDLDVVVLQEDSWLVALSKPAGYPSHPLRPGERGTVANFLVGRYPEMQGVGYSDLEAGLLHRLDRDTSGVLVAARTRMAFDRLRSQFEQRRVVKIYLAVVWGHPPGEGTVAFPIGSRGRRARKVRVCQDRSDPQGMRSIYAAETSFRVIRAGERCSLVRLAMRTGVRHQIRAHMNHLGHPVVGDGLYGPGSRPGTGLLSPPPCRQLLHASEIRLVHPEDGREVRIHCPLPPDFRACMHTYGLGDARGGTGSATG